MTTTPTPAQNWLLSRKWGVFFHYLDHIQNGEGDLHNTAGVRTDWNSCVNELDVKRIAKALHEVNAGFAAITVVQCSHHLCAPSAVLDDIIGVSHENSPTSRRDLIWELSDALSEYDIPLFLYFTGDGPRFNPESMTAFSGDPRPVEPGVKPVTRPFAEKWSAVMRELSLRYGKRISGWWLDGMYRVTGFDDIALLQLFKDAARAGNPDALFAANYNGCFVIESAEAVQIPNLGEVIFADFYHKVVPPSPVCDYTACEVDCLDVYPTGQLTDGAQSLVFSYLGIPEHPVQVYNGFSAPGCKYSAQYLRRYVDQVNRLGGAVMLDACLYRDGTMDNQQLQALTALKDLR